MNGSCQITLGQIHGPQKLKQQHLSWMSRLSISGNPNHG